MICWETAVWGQVARSGFIENNIPRKVVLPGEVANMPAYSIVLISYEDSFISTRTTFSAKLRWDRREALAPPYAEV
jgi:hypothetical protein